MVKFKDKAHSKQELLEIKRKRNAKISAVVISLIFLLSALVVFVQNEDVANSSSVKVGSYIFNPKTIGDSTVLEITTKNVYDKSVFFTIVDENYTTYFYPSEKAVLDVINNKSFVYISIDPTLIENNADALQYQELGRVDLNSFLTKGNKVVFNSMESPYKNSIVFGCQNATESAGVISFVHDTTVTGGIYVDESNSNCVKIISTPEYAIKLTDILKFAILQE
jgi:hypothetical protein